MVAIELLWGSFWNGARNNFFLISSDFFSVEQRGKSERESSINCDVSTLVPRIFLTRHLIYGSLSMASAVARSLGDAYAADHSLWQP